jgi:phosphoenolpyruvate synthase/pyruvate phosphate dikinase
VLAVDALTASRDGRNMGAQEHQVDYSEDPMLINPEYARVLLSRIAKAGHAVEQVLGSAQDLEGCITSTGELYIVQSRPQV